MKDVPKMPPFKKGKSRKLCDIRYDIQYGNGNTAPLSNVLPQHNDHLDQRGNYDVTDTLFNTSVENCGMTAMNERRNQRATAEQKRQAEANRRRENEQRQRQPGPQSSPDVKGSYRPPTKPPGKQTKTESVDRCSSCPPCPPCPEDPFTTDPRLDPRFDLRYLLNTDLYNKLVTDKVPGADQYAPHECYLPGTKAAVLVPPGITVRESC